MPTAAHRSVRSQVGRSTFAASDPDSSESAIGEETEGKTDR
jgi:hypothetical protein